LAYAFVFYAFLTAFILAVYGFVGICRSIAVKIKTGMLLERIRDKYDLLYLDFRDYVNVVAEALRRKGHSVRITDCCGEDGNGLEIDGNQYAEVLKTNLNDLVEVETAMKLAWCMRTHSIYRGRIIALGDFRQNTRTFCHNHVISCMNGDGLLAMCKEVQRKKAVPDWVK
jgi:restriction system protein